MKDPVFGDRPLRRFADLVTAMCCCQVKIWIRISAQATEFLWENHWIALHLSSQSCMKGTTGTSFPSPCLSHLQGESLSLAAGTKQTLVFYVLLKHISVMCHSIDLFRLLWQWVLLDLSLWAGQSCVWSFPSCRLGALAVTLSHQVNAVMSLQSYMEATQAGERHIHSSLSSSAWHHWQLAHETACKSLGKQREKASVFAALSSLRKGLCSRHCSPCQIISRALYKAQNQTASSPHTACSGWHHILSLYRIFAYYKMFLHLSLVESRAAAAEQADWEVYGHAKSMQNTVCTSKWHHSTWFYPLPLTSGAVVKLLGWTGQCCSVFWLTLSLSRQRWSRKIQAGAAH